MAWTAKETSTHASWLTIWKRIKSDDPKSSKLKNGLAAVLGASTGQLLLKGVLLYSPAQSSSLTMAPDPSLQETSFPLNKFTAYSAKGISSDMETNAACKNKL